MDFTTRKNGPTVKMGSKVAPWMQDVTIKMNSTQNDGQSPPGILKIVQDNYLNRPTPTKVKSRKNTVPTGQPFRPKNSTPSPFKLERDTNLYGSENVGDGPANFHIPNRKMTKKERRELLKQQRTKAFGTSNANGDPTQKNDDHNPSTIDDDKPEHQMAVAETYADYKPSKLKFGAPHPDAVVETATLSSIEPNDITYELSLPTKIIEKGQLSALQLESIVYASQAHEKMLPDETRAGFLIGDGAGVGKGRTVAGVIVENFQQGRKKAIWVSVSNDLKYDAERDLSDIGAPNIEVWALNKLKYGQINSRINGNICEGVIFSTYSSLISATSTRTISVKYNTRLKQLVDWCGPDFDGVIIFDECHKAKNLIATGRAKPTKTGQAVLDLQVALPLARVVYASATGASEPRNMAYMVRLGLWGEGTPFRNFPEFLQTVDRRGVGVMEVVAMDMKLRGMYIARQLSFKGATFQVEEVPLTDEFKQAYNDSVKLWVDARDKFDEASVLIGGNNMLRRSMWGQFWGAHQRFFKYLCIASKVSYAVQVAKQAVKDGKCAVIGLQSTGEARTLEAIEHADGELEDFISTAKAVFENLIEKQFPAPSRRFVGGAERKPAATQNTKSPIGKKRNRSSSIESDGSIGPNSRRLRQRAKVRRVIYSDDSDESDSEKTMPIDIDSDDDDGVTKAKKKSKTITISDSDTDSDSNSDSKSESDSDGSSEYSSSGESESSFLDDKADDSDTGGSGSDAGTVRSATRRRPYGKAKKTGTRTMQDKVKEQIQKQLVGAPTTSKLTIGSQQANNAIMDMARRACDMRDELFDKIDKLGDRLPPNTLDQLIEELGGPDEVAELTGRKGRVVKTESGEVQYESRCQGDSALDTVNIYEKDLFMNGDKFIAIISEAASNGISLQSDRRAQNQRRRVHITLELPWSADRAIQQFGRTHRSNQMNAPEYIFLISNLAGERRFASSVSKRLESLGALTHGDRRATETRNLSQFNVENSYGRKALNTVCEKIFIIEYTDLTGDETEEEQEHHNKLVQVSRALRGVDIESGEIPIPKFLNRILGLPVDLQNYLFDYFMDALDAAVESAKRMGTYDLGIMDLGNTDSAEKIRSIRFTRKHVTGVAPINITTVVLERGITWDEVKKKSAKITHEKEGFYKSKFARETGKRSVFLALLVDPVKAKPILDSGSLKIYNIPFQTHRPHLGTNLQADKFEEVIRAGIKIGPEEAEKLWKCHYDSSTRQCIHVFWSGRCRNSIAGSDCDVGMSRRRYTVLSGSIFAYWSQIEHHVRRESNSQIRVIRLKLTDGTKIVGVLLPESSVDDIIRDLQETSIDVKEEKVEVKEEKVQKEIKVEKM